MLAFLNIAAYQLAWFAVVIGAARGLAWAGAAVALAVAALHLCLWRTTSELRLMGLCLFVGLALDSTLVLTGQLRFTGWNLDIAPYWMLSLWLAFATTLNHSLRWLMSRPLAATLGGALGGPLAYLAGEKLGALSVATTATTLPRIALLWAAAMLALSLALPKTPPLRVTGNLTA